jgi:uncharacterized membrane protein
VALGLAVLATTRTLVLAAYGLLALGMALVSVGLVLMQAFVIHAGCGLCLVSAVISWLVAILVVPEAVRAVRHRSAPSLRAAADDDALPRAA